MVVRFDASSPMTWLEIDQVNKLIDLGVLRGGESLSRKRLRELVAANEGEPHVYWFDSTEEFFVARSKHQAIHFWRTGLSLLPLGQNEPALVEPHEDVFGVTAAERAKGALGIVEDA